MRIKQIKIYVIALIILPVFALMMFNTGSVRGTGAATDDEALVKEYKTKCLACHGPQAAKFYDPEMAMEEQVEVIMKGKKGEKPPFMPGYEAKGMTTEQATALAEYMKALRTPADN